MRFRDSSLGCGTELLSLSGTPPASPVIHTEPENKIFFFKRFLTDTCDTFRSCDRDEAICGQHYQPKHTGTIFNVLYSFITFLWTMTHFLLFTIRLSLSLPLRAIRHPSQTAVEGLMLQNEYIKCIFIISGKDQMCNCA